MFRYSSIVAVIVALFVAGALPAQDRTAIGRGRAERWTPRVERGGVQRSPRQTDRKSSGERRSHPRLSQEQRNRIREQGSVPGRSMFTRPSQERHDRPAASGLSRGGQQGRVGYHELFGTVQQGLASGSAGTFSGHLAPQVYVNLRGGESGYYSANQAHYVLENYFKTRRLVNVKFSTIGESDANPYATGSATFVERGTRSLAQVYVSLTRSGERWIITQINIY
jgi:hypothetical protein